MRLYCVRDDGYSVFGSRIVASENYAVTMLRQEYDKKWVSALYKEYDNSNCVLFCATDFQKILGPLAQHEYTVIEVNEVRQ